MMRLADLSPTTLGADRGAQGLIHGTPILPAQFYTGPSGGVHDTGEGRLMARMLEEAVADVLVGVAVHTARKSPNTRSAEAWIADTDRTWPFSFENICDTLGIDPDAVRTGLARRVVARGGAYPRRHHGNAAGLSRARVRGRAFSGGRRGVA